MSEFVFKDFVVERCVECGKFRFKGSFKSVSFPVLVKSLIPNVVSVSFDEKVFSFRKLPRKFDVVLSVFKDDVLFDVPVFFKSKNVLCSFCSKKKSDYFEATLQLRNVSDSKVFSKVKELVFSVGDVVKEEKYFRFGADFKLTSNKSLRKVLKLLEDSFFGFSKVSASLFSKDRLSQKELFRLTGLFYFFGFKKFDVIFFNNVPFVVLGVNKGKVFLFSLVDFKEFSFKSELLRDVRVLDTFVSSVVRVSPDVFVLDEDFQPVSVVVPSFFKDNLFLDDKVVVFKFEGKFFIIRRL